MSADLVAFLTAAGRDSSGRTFDAVLAMDDAGMENSHDFIQWLFPLPEPSQSVPGSPMLDAVSLADLRASATAQARVEQAASRMRAFYADTTRWRRAYDHNHLRITRIIRSLRLIVGDRAADAFRAQIIALAGDAPVGSRARAFWAQA